VSIGRQALKDFTFSDGTYIPKGTFVSAAMSHHDDDVYPDAGTFKGFRFSDIREEDGEGTKNQMVATSLEFLTFGHGRHSWWVVHLLSFNFSRFFMVPHSILVFVSTCTYILRTRLRNSPGRFFAAHELKAMMAHILVTYDIMMTDKPQVSWFGTARVPDAKAEVMFRRRQT
jgi:Cytochrome P450